MAQIPESLNMDRRSLTFSKKHQLTISKNLAFLVLFAFIVCIVVTALVAHFVTRQVDEHRYQELLNERAGTGSQDGSTSTTTSATTTSTTITTTTTTSMTSNNDNTNATSTNPARTEASTSPTIEVTSTETDRDTVAGPQVLRLPRSVVPIDYDLRILTVMSNLTFSGSSTIHVNVTISTDNITLHAVSLDLACEEVHVVKVASEEEVTVSKCNLQKEQEFFILHFDSPLEEGLYNIRIPFAGKLNMDLAGYYASSYQNGSETRWLAATQFEPTDARRAFPCFDEPSFKATFKITMGRPNNLTSISNMPRIASIPHADYEDYTWDEFERSVPMSTYLVAYIVSDFKARSIGNFSLFARESAFSQTQVAADLGPKFLAYLEKFFNIPFPLPKMDLAAIPDFSAGAMENWGLITFRETELLYEEGVSTKQNMQRIATVIAHELGHQWFGNLVTPSWWTDLWLNEGFATFLESSATDAVFPEWKMMDQFVVNDLQMCFNLDSLKTSHPISVVVQNPNEVNEIFDTISYEKGASIIRMMEDFLTTSCFRKGLTNYLNAKKYHNAEQDDLWDALTVQAQQDNIFNGDFSVKEVMDTWTLQMGFPVITINRTENQGIRITQEKFELNRKNVSTNYSWSVPLTYQSMSGSPGRSWLPKGTKTDILANIVVSNSDWFLVNLNQTGYYRVNYDQLGWSLLEGQLKKDHTKLDPKNRAQIMDDALSLANAGYISYATALNLTTYLHNEEEYVPWAAAIENLNFLFEMFQRSGHFDKFQAYLEQLIRPIYKQLSFTPKKGESALRTFLREKILGKASALGLPDCIKWAHTEFHNWMLSPNPDAHNSIIPDLKRIVYCTAIEVGGDEEWNFAWKRYLNTNVGNEKEMLLTGLGCTHRTWILNKFMTMSITPNSGIRKQDVVQVFRAVGKNIVGQAAAFRFVLSNWSEIATYMGKSVTPMNNILKAVSNNLNTEKELEELQTFSTKYGTGGTLSQRIANQIIEQTQANIDWMQNYFKSITEWFTENAARTLGKI